MTTYSATMFSYELDVLEIRLATLDPVVDRHIIIESPLTHAGEEKPLVLTENRDRFSKWAHKIDLLVDASPPGGNWAPQDAQPFAESISDHWRREHHQRDALSRALQTVAPGDLILLSDCDEIPDPARCWPEAEALARAGLIVCPKLAMHVGRLRWRWPIAVPGTRTRFLTGETLAQHDHSTDGATTAHSVIIGPEGPAGLGWHLAYMGGVAEVQRKLASFAHQELNRPPFNTEEHIAACLETGADLFMRDVQCHECPTEDVPACVWEDGRLEALW